MEKRLLGIIGGVGPSSTVYFADLVIRMTRAKADQDHIDMVILNHATIPDRTAFIMGKSGESPLPAMQSDAKTLEALHASCIAIPCNTAHYFYNEIQSSVSIPVINIIQETVDYIAENLKSVKKVGIMATRGTIYAGSYQLALEQRGLTPVAPDEAMQASLMDIIYNQVKAGIPADIGQFHAIVSELKEQGCDAVILGCTELSLIRRDYRLFSPEIVDSLEVLAYRSVVLCGKLVNRGECHLVTVN